MGPTGPTGPTGSRGAKGTKGDKGDKGDKVDVGSFDTATEKQLILVNKNFGNRTYPHAFQSFQFEDSGADAPFNGSRGRNLIVTKSITCETVPILGSRAPIEITQDINVKYPQTEIAFTALHSQTQSYGIIFAIQDFNNNTPKTVNMTAYNGTLVFSSAPLKRLGTADYEGKTYEYYLGRVAVNTSTNAKAKFVVQFMYTTASLPEGKMTLNIYV
jgi:hypothetical protein